MNFLQAKKCWLEELTFGYPEITTSGLSVELIKRPKGNCFINL